MKGRYTGSASARQTLAPLQWPFQRRDVGTLSPLLRCSSSTRNLLPAGAFAAASVSYPLAAPAAMGPGAFVTSGEVSMASPHGLFRSAVSQSHAFYDPPPPWALQRGAAAETSALMAKVQSVSAKAEHILASAGRVGSARARPRTAPWQRGSGSERVRLAELTERLSKLELLLDEVASLGSFKLAPWNENSVGSSRLDHSSGNINLSAPAGALSARSSVDGRGEGSGSSSITIPVVVVPQQRTNGYAPLHGAAPPPVSSRFIEVSTSGSRSVPLAGCVTPPPPVAHQRSVTPTGTARMAAQTPRAHPPGTTSPVPPPNGGALHLNGVNGMASLTQPGQAMSLPAAALGVAPIIDGWQGTAQLASGPRGQAWQGSGSYTPLTQRSSMTPRGAMVTPRGAGFGPTAALLGHHLVETPLRAISAPLRSSSPPPVNVTTAHPPLPQTLPLAIGFTADGFCGMGNKVPTPMPPPPVGLFMPPLGQIKQESVEEKIRQWLQQIPIGNGAERGWDDSQIAEIADFAQDQHLEHLDVEEIYKRYVEHQVELASMDA